MPIFKIYVQKAAKLEAKRSRQRRSNDKHRQTHVELGYFLNAFYRDFNYGV